MRLPRRPTPAGVVAFTALAVAVGGTAYAAGLPRNSVGTAQLRNSAVTGKKLAAGSVDARAVRNDSLTGRDIRESSLGTVPNAAALGGQPASAFTSNQDVVRVPPFQLTAGQTREIASVPGSLSLTARCRIDVGNNDIADVIAATAENASILDAKDHLASFNPATAEGGREWLTVTAANKALDVGSLDGVMAAPSGHSLSGRVWAGVNVFGGAGKCTFGAVLIRT